MEQLKKIYESINKIEFKYGIIDSNKNPTFIAKIDSSLGIKEELAYISRASFIGYAEIDNFSIIQRIKIENKHLRIIYLIFDHFLNFKQNFNLNLDNLKIFHLLKEWQYTDKNGDRFLYLLENIKIPSEFKQCKKPLYRGLNLSPLAIKKIVSGKSVTLLNKKFSSWSENKEQALRHTSIKNPIRLMYSPKNEVLINIQLFYNFIGYYDNLYEYEEEVILVNSPKMLTIFPNQVEIKNDKIRRGKFFKNKYIDKNYLDVKIESKNRLN